MDFKFKLAAVDQIVQGKGLVVKGPKGEEIALFNVEGKIFALKNVCPHMGGPLGEGELEGCIVTGPWHGLQFDVKNGACEDGSGENAMSIAVQVEGDSVYL